MKQAIEQAGSIFTGWISSCLFCLGPRDDESFRHQQAMKQRGAEREMRICHTQPHLVPPMKLVVYDDLPSPSPPPPPPARASTLSSWVVEGRTRASRASMSLKRKSTAPVRISAPSDFRHVSMFSPTTTTTITTEVGPKGFRPLELGFNSPTNRLPELPRFEDYQLEGERAQITPPPRALSTTETGRVRSHRPSSSFQLLRKPVGSGSRRSSLGTIEQLLERQSQSQSQSRTSPLIPHFSTRSSVLSALSSPASPKPDLALAGIFKSHPHVGANNPTPATAIPPPPRTPTRPTATNNNLDLNLQDRPLPSIPPDDSSCPSPSPSPSHPPTTPSDSRPPTTPSDSNNNNNNNHTHNPNRTPTRSGRVTQWLFQTSSPNNISKTTGPHPQSPTPFRLRSRTLSGSTLVSSITNLTGHHHHHHSHNQQYSHSHSHPSKPTPSLTSATTMRADTTRDKDRNGDKEGGRDMEGDFDLPLDSPFLPKQKQTFASVTEESSPGIYQYPYQYPVPTIYEGEGQIPPPSSSPSPRDQDEFHTEYYENYRLSAVGVAF
ncbi:hypothetical protein BO70DRAFT_321228 [Aspergillus heteromorphus CBS 117.55]|uniref:Uncharacterized protein n=1 Tax=Aspergillus heteromorphus CBS 117.55 TaxID=1448321 RepID=A0A317VCP9_9EURO|nr:uncharacterized protein BO70DRAFT_321228 [Aspergillus heteromorphus CBS 117.55]PWY71765.1 hypothetical protein BO70DRAFT_321228 [Aspergillus heteromorphus CBS 117.55]